MLAEPDHTPPARRSRVLVVDDHTETTELLRILLGRRGFDVTTARSVATAMAAIEASPVDVLVSDVNLPDGDGCDLLQRLREAHEARRLPAIALSGLDRDADRRRGLDAGFDEYLAKPVGIDQLVGALRRVSSSAQP
jgi:DNA-binding response OmpR family regulator